MKVKMKEQRKVALEAITSEKMAAELEQVTREGKLFVLQVNILT